MALPSSASPCSDAGAASSRAAGLADGGAASPSAALLAGGGAHVLASLLVLTSDRALLQLATDELEAFAQIERARGPQWPDQVALAAREQRDKRAWLAGDIDEREYGAEQRRIAAITATAAPTGGDRDWATALLGNLAELITQATKAERRAVLLEIFDRVYFTPHQAMAARPAMAYAKLLKTCRERCVVWAGWAPGQRSDTPYTLLHPRRVAA
jgi:hypothetical protein